MVDAPEGHEPTAAKILGRDPDNDNYRNREELLDKGWLRGVYLPDRSIVVNHNGNRRVSSAQTAALERIGINEERPIMIGATGGPRKYLYRPPETHGMPIAAGDLFSFEPAETDAALAARKLAEEGKRQKAKGKS